MCKQFLNDNPDSAVIYFESESAITKQMIEERGIDSSRVVINLVTVQELELNQLYIRPIQDKTDMEMLFVLDSLGMLSPTKEIEDTTGSETRDMTRACVSQRCLHFNMKLGKEKC